jgi:hypothetical protein
VTCPVRKHEHFVTSMLKPMPARRRLASILSGGQRTVENGDNLSCRWLRAAADMAAMASGNCQLSTGPGLPRWACFPPMVACTQGVDTRSVRAARDFTVATCGRWGMAERCEDIGIVVSELLTNALCHALPGSGQGRPGWPVQLGLLQPGSGVLCAVADPSPSAPAPRTPDYFAETGRGLQIVGALSDEWGCITCTTSKSKGKVVWAMFLALPVCNGQDARHCPMRAIAR